MKTIIDVDDQQKIELNDLGGKVKLTIYYRTDNMDWVVQCGTLIEKNIAASVGASLIEQAGKDREMLKPKYQRNELEI